MLLKKVSLKTAKEVCADITLEDDVTDILNDTVAPGDFLAQLIEAKNYQDAIRFLSRALPGRESAWWACLSARHVIGDAPPAAEMKALELAEHWVFKPTDENMQAAHDAAEAIETDTPTYWAGMAVFWSSGSMAPPDVPEVPVAPNLCGMAVSGAVLLAGLADDVDESNQRYVLFLKQGIAIANGDNAKEVV